MRIAIAILMLLLTTGVVVGFKVTQSRGVFTPSLIRDYTENGPDIWNSATFNGTGNQANHF